MEGEAHADAVVAQPRAAQGSRRVRGVPVRDPGQPGGRFPEDGVLVVRERVVGFVGVGHVRGEAFDDEVRQRPQVFGERDRGVDFQAEAMEAGIDFDVDGGGDAGSLSGGESDSPSSSSCR